MGFFFCKKLIYSFSYNEEYFKGVFEKSFLQEKEYRQPIKYLSQKVYYKMF